MTHPFRWDPHLQKTLETVAGFYDARKVGHVGAEGFRKSTPLMNMIPLLQHMIHARLLIPNESIFFDMGCADARVNIFMSYLVKQSIGVEIDEWTLEEALPIENDLKSLLRSKSLAPPPGNCHLFHGDTLSPDLQARVKKKTGVDLVEVDLFYTFLTLYDLFAELIRSKGRKGSIFMVFGLDLIVPVLSGFERIPVSNAISNQVVLYRKK